MKKTLILACALAMTAFVSARADEFTVSGTTTGSFGSTSTNVYKKLTFTNGSFSDMTSGGFAAIGAQPGDNLGTFTLGSSAFTTGYNDTFSLNVVFTAPPGAGGGTYTAAVTGSVTHTAGGVFIDFNNTPQTFTFSSATQTGSFTLVVNDVSVSVGGTVPVTGTIMGTASAVPDGGTSVALLGAALVGLAAVRRKLALG